MNAAQKKQIWLQGYACAVATLQRIEDGAGGMLGVRAIELMSAGGLTRKACEAARVDEYDMAALFPDVRERCCNVCGKEWKGGPECPSCYAEDSSVIGETASDVVSVKEK